jgi:hypothetical protein
MKYIKTFEQYIEDTILESSTIDPDLEDIRYFRGSILQFKDYWERKMNVKFNPHGEVKYKYPAERTETDKSLPYQDFVNGESSNVKYSLNNRKRGIDKK